MFFNWKQAKTDSSAVRLQKALLEFKKAKNSPVVVAKVKKTCFWCKMLQTTKLSAEQTKHASGALKKSLIWT